MSLLGPARAWALAGLMLATSCKKEPPPSAGIIDVPYSLRSYLNEAELIAEGRVEAVEGRVAVVRLGRALKGNRPAETFRLNVGKGGYLDAEPSAVLRHAVPGAPLLIFSSGNAMVLYLNRFFLVAYGTWNPPTGAAWDMSYIDMGSNRTWNGTVEALAALVPEALAGRAACPPLDPGRPPITVAALNELPLWNVAVDEEYLSAPFVPTRPPKPSPRAPEGALEVVTGLQVEIFDATWGQNLDTLRPKTEGPGLIRRRGFLDVPRDGDYFLILDSATRATLTLGTEMLVCGEGGAERGADVALKAGRHALAIVSEGPVRLLWSGPGIERQPVPADRLSRRP